MGNRTFFLVTMVASGVFVYLIASFLVATFNINLWYDYYRFFVVLAYLFLFGGLVGTKSDKPEVPTKKVVTEENEIA